VIVLVFVGSSDQLKSGMYNLTTVLVYEVQLQDLKVLLPGYLLFCLYFLFHLFATKGDK